MRIYSGLYLFIVILFLIGPERILFAQNKIPWKVQKTALQTKWTKKVNIDHPLPEYPRPQMVRQSKWQNLNGLWKYSITPKDSSIPTHFVNQILVPYPIESALSGVKKPLHPNECLWYYKMFKSPLMKFNERLLLHFGAVDWQATVYINGKEVGSHTGGYTSFNLDVTGALNDGDNNLVVKVYDPTDQGVGPHGKQVLSPGNIYYTASSGIWQTVWLEKVPACYISHLKITPDIDKGELHLTVELEGNNDQINVLACASNGRSVTGRAGDDLTIKIPNAHLWSPDDPFLYGLSVKLINKSNGSVKDNINSYFGMRKISIHQDDKGFNRIFLNNKYTYNLGTLDQGFWPDGLYTAPTDEALAFDIKAIKMMGFNTIRKHIKIEPARWYYHADKIGMLVWQDFVNPNQQLPNGAKQAFEQQVKETMSQLQNYPCITTWVIFNENWGQYDQQRMTEWVKSLDSSRLVDGHSGELLYVNNELRSPSLTPYVSADMTDVHSYPFPRNAISQPKKAKVLGEFGGIGVTVEGHLWNDFVNGWGYDGVVNSLVMKRQFNQMIDSLKTLEKEGLTASIYTQPFDVESEQNGLITYDRFISKIPIQDIRQIQSRLWPTTRNYTLFSKEFTLIPSMGPVSNYSSRLQQFQSGKKDSTFLRRLVLMALKDRDQINLTRVANAYIKQCKDLFNEDNISFVYNTTRTSYDTGFYILMKNAFEINKYLGNSVAQMKVMDIIDKEYIHPVLFTSNREANIDSLENFLAFKFGDLGKERLWGELIAYFTTKEDWKKTALYYKLYFNYVYDKKRIESRYFVNNITWPVFENVNDPEAINLAIKIMKYCITSGSDIKNYNAHDTYANLLYKAGRKDDAIKIEENILSAVPNEHEIIMNLEKMRNNVPTWNISIKEK